MSGLLHQLPGHRLIKIGLSATAKASLGKALNRLARLFSALLPVPHSFASTESGDFMSPTSDETRKSGQSILL